MSILIYAESADGKLKKVAFELASYAKKVAESWGTTVTAVTINNSNTSELASYGVDKVICAAHSDLDKFNARNYAEVVQQAAKKENSTLVVLSASTDSLYIAPMLSVFLGAGFASNVVSLPTSQSPLRLKRTAFSNKAFVVSELNNSCNVISLAKNSFGLFPSTGAATQENFVPTLSATASKVEVTGVEKSTGKVTIADADIVVSAGRGLKGPENWGMIEELASVLGAATACSKPVSDLGWRSHSEHVGQTGKPVATNLYIAIGISGAIQHIAGVNSSKVKVVINTDPEAPFFKVADYGVVGDAFEVVPQLIEKLKAFKAQ
jgi:electron transfer flavoprotein alpha subunit